MRRNFFRTATFAAILLISACGRGEVGRENARAYFNEHRDALENVVAQVDECQPEEGRIDRSSNAHCLTPHVNPQNLLDAMHAADAQWIRAFYKARDGAAPSLRSVHISTYAFGVAYAGAIEQFIYEIIPETEASYERHDYGDAVLELEPVTEAPHHWYWRKIDR